MYKKSYVYKYCIGCPKYRWKDEMARKLRELQVDSWLELAGR